MKKLKVKFNPKTTFRVAYKGHIYRLSTENEGQFVELPFPEMDKKEAKELLEHLKNIGILSSYDTEVVEDKEEVNDVSSDDTLDNRSATEKQSAEEKVEKQSAEEKVTEEQNTEEPVAEGDTTEKSNTKETTRKRRKRSK
ncbi:hypothetical protein PGDDIFCJ_00154 [Thermus phage YS40_Isch]|nr:hypothetical protein PGDDIFCJ_00154 [Thermus phage YS40_Isch]